MRNYFTTKELVPPEVFKQRGESARQLMDSRIIDSMNQLRDWIGKPMIVNSEKLGRVASGLRVPSSPHYSPTSQHSKGKAIDSICHGVAPQVFHKEILENPGKYPHIRFIEIDVGWLHIDCRGNEGDECRVWSPKRGFVPVVDYLKEIA